MVFLKICAYELDSNVFGLDKSNPATFNPSKIAEAVTVKISPIRNWMKILFCCPKRRFEITDDNTNIHANEQTKAATTILEFNDEAKNGKETAIVVRAVSVKIW